MMAGGGQVRDSASDVPCPDDSYPHRWLLPSAPQTLSANLADVSLSRGGGLFEVVGPTEYGAALGE
jgi:hypothetical protein